MPSDSGFQDSVDKSREALRRSIADGNEHAGPAQNWAAEPRAHSAPNAAPAEHWAAEPPPQSVPHARPPLAGLHPFFCGLLDTLPEPGMDWPAAQREQWLETARNIFALLYHDPGDAREPIPLRLQPRIAPDAAAGTMYPSERHIA